VDIDAKTSKTAKDEATQRLVNLILEEKEKRPNFWKRTRSHLEGFHHFNLSSENPEE
jgi:hypothetical protein